MNPKRQNHLRALFDDVISSSASQHDCGPTRAEVSHMLRRERARSRRRMRVSLLCGALLALLAFPLLRNHSRTSRTSLTDAGAVPQAQAAPIVIEHVNDEELFALLEDTPAALMEWPNGERTLLVVNR